MTNFSMRRVRAVVIVQFHEFYRDFGTVFLNIIFPVMFVAGLIMTNLASPSFKFKIGVVEQQQDHASQAFVQILAATPGIEVKSMTQSRTLPALKNGDAHAVFVVDNSGFAENRGNVEVITSPRFEGFSRVLLDAVRDRMVREADPQARAFNYRISGPETEVRTDFTFTFPGLLALAMVQLGLFATAVPLLQARDRGTLRYMSMTSLTMVEMLLGQLALRVGIALVQVCLILAAGSTMLTLSVEQWLQVFAVSVLGIVLLVAIGYAIAGLASSPQAGTALILITNFSMLLGGNIFMDPNDSSAQYVIACVMPISYLADLYRQVITGAAGLWPVWLDIVVTLAWSAAAVAVAIRTFRFDTDVRASMPVGRLLARPNSI